MSNDVSVVSYPKYVLCQECADKNELIPTHFCGHDDRELKKYYWDAKFDSYVVDNSEEVSNKTYLQKMEEWKVCCNCLSIKITKEVFCLDCLKKSAKDVFYLCGYTDLDNLICSLQYMAYQDMSTKYSAKIREYVEIKERLRTRICSEETHI